MHRIPPDEARTREGLTYDPLAPGFDENPHSTYAALRAYAPIHYCEVARGWVLSRYDDIVAVLRDPRFVTDRSKWERAADSADLERHPEYRKLSRNGLFALSRENHLRVRRLVSPAFTPRAVARLAPEIQRIVDDALAPCCDREILDLPRDFAEQIPVRVISSMLKIPSRHDEAFRRFASASIEALNVRLSGPELDRVLAPIPEGVAVVHEVIEERRQKPLEDDMLTTLIEAEEQGDHLSTDELIALVSGLLAAGSETTVHFICFAVYTLLRFPELLSAIRSEPALLDGALEEVLRWDNFGKMGFVRFAAEDVEFGGVKIAKGQMVTGLLGSALRDESAFADPHAFNPRREEGASLAFGSGAHYCLGASLGRLEGRIAVGTLLERFSEMELVRGPVFGRNTVLRQMDSMLVRVRK